MLFNIHKNSIRYQEKETNSIIEIQIENENDFWLQDIINIREVKPPQINMK